MNDLDLPTLERLDKRFKAAQAKVAMLGWKLVRSHPEDEDFVFAFGLDGTALTFRDAKDAVQRICGEAQCLASSAA
ncbi:MAG: hypothetical protein EAZ37_04840 [Burkholderiales bacterium]|nr:MAG: hypothetical protein EAZ37_04840 [Burkholderiales bacterium]